MELVNISNNDDDDDNDGGGGDGDGDVCCYYHHDHYYSFMSRKYMTFQVLTTFNIFHILVLIVDSDVMSCYYSTMI